MQNKNGNDYIIELDNVVVRYIDAETGQPKTVLNDIDLRVRQGELVTLVGPSGCGKSTLFRQIAGSERPTSGGVQLNGRPVTHPNRDCGIVFQRYSLFDHLTAIDNVMFGPDMESFSLVSRCVRLWKRYKLMKQWKAQAMEMLDRVGLAQHAKKYPNELSGGQRQRVAIVRALIMRPPVLLMDEPFGALDDSTRQDMQTLLLEIWERDKPTIIFVTHDLEEAVFLGTRIMVLSQYYVTDAPDSEGSKIVIDCALPPRAMAHGFKYTPEFNALLSNIRDHALKPKVRRHVSEFDLTHPDSFRTVNPREWKADAKPEVKP